MNFTATVNGTGNYDRSVNWYVDDVAGGTAATGTIGASGNYCAPAQPPTNNPVSIKAVANGDNSKYGTVATRVITISITPTQAQLYVGDTQQFTATVSGATNSSLIWMVNGKVSGNATIGTISATGLYAAPSQVTDLALSVQAAPSEAPSIYANANLTVSGKIVILPANPQVPYLGSQQFNATVVGSTDTQVNWRATYGSITSSGLYTASAAQSPDAISAWTSNANGSTTVQVLGLKPVITSISPQPATAGQTITVTGQNLDEPATAIFSDSIGGQLPVTVYGSDDGSSFTVTVPQGSVTGPFFVRTQNGGLPPVNSNTLTFQRLARLRIRTPYKDLSAGESVTLLYALLGDSTPQTVTFSADLGTFSGATYQAPGNVTADTFANVTACISATQSCDTLMLGLHPFRITPDVPLVGIGQSLQLSAILGGNVTGANWNLLAGGGSLSSGGLYSAGTKLQDGGPAIVSAVANSAIEQTQVGVTGAFPGLLNRVYDYFDQRQPNAPTTVADGLVVVGNRMYVAASNHLGAYTDSYFWIDIYDLTDPLHPAWLTAVEASSAGPLFSIGQYLYSYQNVDIAVPGYPNTITVYQLQNQIPVLKTRATVEQWYDISNHQGVLTSIPVNGSAPPGSSELLLYDLTSGSITSRDFNIQLPADANSYLPDTTVAVGNRLFVSEIKNDISQGGYIITYDLTTSPPNLLGTVDGRSLNFYSSGSFLFGALGGMDTYDISGQLPQYLSHVDGINATQLNGTQLLAITEQQGFRMLDMTNPQMPQQTAILFDGVIIGYDISQLAGNYVYDAAGDAGIAIYDASHSGGPVYKTRLFGGGFNWSEIFDLHLRSPYLYGAAATSEGATLNVYDLSTNPATRVGQYFDQNQECFALQSSGNYLYLGLTNSLDVFDLTNPTSPALATTVSLPVVSLARSGNILYAGTSDNRLVMLDITNPAQPQILTSLALGDLPARIHVFGTRLLIADATAGLLIYNISTPASPALLSQVTGFASVNDVTLSGTTAFLAADVDGLAIFDLSNPAQPLLISQTLLSRIDPFDNMAPPNQALSLSLYNGKIYVGTFYDNGLVLGYDYTNPVTPRLVSTYAHGDFILTDIITMLFNGSDLFIGGNLGFAYPLAQVDMSHPFDSINQYFPPLALQIPGPLNGDARRARIARKRLPMPSQDPRFFKVPPEKIRHHAFGHKVD